MSNCTTHNEHDHKHGASCGHTSIVHDDHTCYLHDGHLHHDHGDHVDEHAMSGAGACTPDHKCESHESAHTHGEGCGHDAVPHGDHVDYQVGKHLHSPCGNHCDDHGEVVLG